eukprot:gene20193-26211_t
MRGFGRILAMFGGQQPHFEIVHYLNLNTESLDIIQPVSSIELAPAAKDIKLHGFIKTNDSITTDVTTEVTTNQTKESNDNENTVPQDSSSNEPTRKRSRAYNASGRQARDAIRLRQYLREGCESLIIASKYHPLPILIEALILLTPSSPI